jgi:hypothetical protein
LWACLAAACSSPARTTDTVATAPPPATQPAPPVVAVATPDAALVDAAVDAGVLADAATKQLGKHGDVCRFGIRHERAGGGPAPVECGPGLRCCYPCGIQGCDFTCMTPAECNVRRP